MIFHSCMSASNRVDEIFLSTFCNAYFFSYLCNRAPIGLTQTNQSLFIMSKIKAIVEFADKNFSAYIPEIDGVIGIADTIEETKRSLEQSIQYCIEDCKEYGVELPEPLREEYEIEYQFDLMTFLQVYGKILSKSRLERLTGINQKQLCHYAAGRSRPRAETKKKIEESIHKLAAELAEITFA